ncbi:MAG: Asp-tRNA(Asn)/Glu-tRNA(Gln) amidotransferase subunit GatB [Chlamydiales bacterium]|nr:Asp-tRNA(Asn)/Glu-tRNA(Gln) amidotransferase subunit GatB [Chlamydiales bacterium]
MMDPSVYNEWELVIGLEIHVELNTKSKLFSPAANRFGDEPNTNISDVCTGQPGTLPVLNKEAVHKAVLFGCAIDANVAKYSRFDRKSYFYPDSPRNFQITQFDMPIIVGGALVADVGGVPKSFGIDKAHLEDDAGMLKHFSQFAGVDYNRAGVPLIEIVSKPCIFSAKEAVAYAAGIKAVLQYLDVSDCNMEEGSLRMDANISVRPKGSQELRNKVEIKNLNSFTFMALAIESEFKRQVREYVVNRNKDPHEVISQATYRWDPDKKETVLMRRKETADDYRYFLEPDLPPLILEQEYIDSVRKSLPELPYEREKRYIRDYDLPRESALLIVNEKALADYFEDGLKVCANAKSLCNWMIVEFAGRFKEKGKSVWTSGIPGEHIGQLVNMIDKGVITGKIAKQVADLMVETPGKAPEGIVEENPAFKPMADEAELETIIDRVLAENQQSVNDFLSGKERAFGFLVGQVMKETKGKAPPPIVNRMLKNKLEKAD